MSWNHRVVRREYPDAAIEEDRVFYQIHETYYLGEDTPSITEEPSRLMEQDMGQLRATLERMLRCLDAPVLDYETRKELS